MLTGYVAAQFRGDRQIVLEGRGVPTDNVTRALTLFFVYSLLIGLTTFLLSMTEHGILGGAQPGGPSCWAFCSSPCPPWVRWGFHWTSRPSSARGAKALLWSTCLRGVWVCSVCSWLCRVCSRAKPMRWRKPSCPSGSRPGLAQWEGPKRERKHGGKKLEIGVIGLGKFGLRMATTLVSLGHTVVGIDQAEGPVQRAEEALDSVYKADATNIAVLRSCMCRIWTGWSSAWGRAWSSP